MYNAKRDRIRNEYTRVATKLKDIAATAMNYEWKWGGNVLRMDPQKMDLRSDRIVSLARNEVYRKAKETFM